MSRRRDGRKLQEIRINIMAQAQKTNQVTCLNNFVFLFSEVNRERGAWTQLFSCLETFQEIMSVSLVKRELFFYLVLIGTGTTALKTALCFHDVIQLKQRGFQTKHNGKTSSVHLPSGVCSGLLAVSLIPNEGDSEETSMLEGLSWLS